MVAVKFNWTDEEYLAASENLTVETARNIIKLFSEGCTIPFIARYRDNLTNGLTPEVLRKTKETYEYIQLLHKNATKLIQKVSAVGSIPASLVEYVQSIKTLEELEFIGSSFKRKSEGTLAERARKLGLEPAAETVLEGTKTLYLEELVDANQPGLKDVKSVREGIKHIIADVISKNAEVLGQLQKIYSSNGIILKSTFSGSVKEPEKSKYYPYKDFSQSIGTIKAHQTLAINRGEAAKELQVKVVIPTSLWIDLKHFCMQKWLPLGPVNSLRKKLLNDSVDDAIKRLLEPLAVRRVRATLKKQAESESICCFALNLQRLLMTSPVNGHVVMGIDPGFAYGCKVAVVSQTGVLICSDVFFLRNEAEACRKLKLLISRNRCEIIALGNGVGHRETEILLNKLITKGTFKPLKVTYTIINEQGVSIYSCSKEAAEEFPGVDPKFVSAISIARRLQNPLSELVKVEPKHLGVGMYQHDMENKKLISTLDEVVSECVSFVGVDINTASFCLLRHVAGLKASVAKEIIKYRSKSCTFKNRQDLLKVKGISTKTFMQCAGFIRIIPATAKCLKHSHCMKDFNPLDETWIHPESYESTLSVLNLFGLSVNALGSQEFIESVERSMKTFTVQELASNANCSNLAMELIIHALKQPRNFDLRRLSQGPVFQMGLKHLKDLFPGQVVKGVVRNVVSFGAFVDVGVGSDGLIHSSKGSADLCLNDRVEVEVLSIKLDPQRIQLKLISVIH